MAERFESYEEKLRTAGLDTGKVDETMRGLVNAANTAVSVGPAAWGPDKFGSKFADGPDGFLSSMEKVVTGTTKMAGSFKSMSDGQYRAADAVQNYERASSENFRI
ncbi:hypothetical protein IU433_19145 [Nocardia puris]|uniref:hypothetical protein n=1 Tax=Nocardia puris TaxID=208602 RepID=UPI001895AB68|nr:hypothetical protein [Nocardia puris]MBF6211560.1 hypothetical protein [Nocardia puris]MBF6366812.1 hypothetical protein [Nocardia puris]MBF6461153.1 hypothetical protein [Nocardia puris]